MTEIVYSLLVMPMAWITGFPLPTVVME